MKSTKKTKKGIKYGNSDLLPEDTFNPKDTKFRVSMYIDLDVLEEVRKRAKDKGLPYQTYINQFLRETHISSIQDERIRTIVREEFEILKNAM